MIPVVVISLPDCVDRRASIRKGLDDLRIPFEFLDAVDGRSGIDPSFEPEVDRGGAERELGRALSDAEIGCALSHINTYRRVVRNNWDWALVCEDDAIPSPDLKTYLENRHFEGADLTQLYFYNTRVSRSGRQHLFKHYSSYLRTIVNSGSCTAYVISNRAAKHILKNGVPITHVADWPKCVEEFIMEKRFRVVYPVIVRHPPYVGQSTITNYDEAGIKKDSSTNSMNKKRKGYSSPKKRMLSSCANGISWLVLRLVTQRITGQQTPTPPHSPDTFRQLQ